MLTTIAVNSLPAALAELDKKDQEIARLRSERSTFDCRYVGSVGEVGGSHCPIDSPCLRCENERLRARVEELEKAVAAAKALIDESQGVYGLHQNGDVTPWSELLAGGRFEEWLVDFSAAIRSGVKEAEGG